MMSSCSRITMFSSPPRALCVVVCVLIWLQIPAACSPLPPADGRWMGVHVTHLKCTTLTALISISSSAVMEIIMMRKLSFYNTHSLGMSISKGVKVG